MTVEGKTRVVVGMSGGVDSSVAAALLLEQGYEVVGITLRLWPQECVSNAQDQSCESQAVMDARAVCQELGIAYYLVDEAAELGAKVIEYFAREYRAGRTPNPCVVCNRTAKFGRLIQRADQLGARYIATGHYARLESRLSGSGARTLLRRGLDPRKDQSYFLFSLRQDQLARTLFTLGQRTKTDTRAEARARNLKTADKQESMEICFVPDDDYGRFLEQAKLAQKHRGDIVDLDGRVLGHHQGIEFYTIGQRKGLGLSSPKPLYVVELDAARNRVVVGEESALARSEFEVERCNWIAFDSPPAPLEATVQIRYRHAGAPATVTPLEGGGARVQLHRPQRAITPGQAAVFYQDDLVLGGGWIRAGNWRPQNPAGHYTKL